MGTFRAHDGTKLAYHLVGEGDPLICLPGGPMRASAYYGDLGGLSGRRQLLPLAAAAAHARLSQLRPQPPPATHLPPAT